LPQIPIEVLNGHGRSTLPELTGRLKQPAATMAAWPPLWPGLARYVDALVASGRYASESDVISAGLLALQEREAGMERWLREEVLPVYDAMQADPGRAIPASQVTAALDAFHAERLKATGHGT
jgi:antitoxin ParD1/3/4